MFDGRVVTGAVVVISISVVVETVSETIAVATGWVPSGHVYGGMTWKPPEQQIAPGGTQGRAPGHTAIHEGFRQS